MKRMSLRYKPRGSKKEEKVELIWDSCVACGYTGRNRKAVLDHIEELKKLGVPAPEKVPATYWVDPERVSTSPEIYVIGDKTSGEVEVFIAKDNKGETFITVGSDHTDRELERISVSKAKQICPKIIATECWKLSEIREHWDKIILRMEVKASEGEGPFILYQEGKLITLLPPEELEKLAYSERPEYAHLPSIFGGTIPILTKETIFASVYRLSMCDPILDRTITHTYKVIKLPDKI